jgi:hypothetical protein
MYNTRWRSAPEMATVWLSVPVLNFTYTEGRPKTFLGPKQKSKWKPCLLMSQTDNAEAALLTFILLGWVFQHKV